MSISWGKQTDPDVALLRTFTVLFVVIIIGLAVWAVTQ